MPSLWTLCVNQFFVVFFFIVGKFLSVIVSFLSKSSAVCSILIQTSDHIYSSHNKHITFGLLVLVRHTCLSVCHLSSLTSTFPSCSLLFAANALMSQSDSNSRVCVCFNVCTRLSFPSLAGFLSFPWWETRVPKEPANVKSQSRLTENLLGNVCVCVYVCETIISGPAERPAVLLFSHQTSVPPPLWPQHPILCSVTSSVCASLQVSNQEAHMYCFSCHTAGNISGYKMFSLLIMVCLCVYLSQSPWLIPQSSY